MDNLLLKSIFLASFHHILEQYLRGEGVAVVDYWFSIISIPAVHCNTMHMFMLITYYLC